MTYQHNTDQINQLADKLEDPELASMSGLSWKAAFHLRELQGRIAELEAKLYAVGAGGVGQSIKSKVQDDTAPAAWAIYSDDGTAIRLWSRDKAKAQDAANKFGLPLVPLYTAPQPARQPLTEDQLRDALRQCPHDTAENLRVRWLYAKDFARAIEAAAANQPARQPLTDSQVKELVKKHPAEDLCRWSYGMGIKDAEAAH